MHNIDTVIPINKVIRTASKILQECEWKLEIVEGTTVNLPSDLELVVQTRAYIEANAPDIFLGNHYEAVVMLGCEKTSDNWSPIHGYLKLYFTLEGNFVSEDIHPCHS